MFWWYHKMFLRYQEKFYGYLKKILWYYKKILRYVKDAVLYQKFFRDIWRIFLDICRSLDILLMCEESVLCVNSVKRGDLISDHFAFMFTCFIPCEVVETKVICLGQPKTLKHSYCVMTLEQQKASLTISCHLKKCALFMIAVFTPFWTKCTI